MFLKRTFFFPLITVLFALNIIIYSASFTYYPSTTSLIPQAPPVVLMPSNNEGITTSLGRNSTSANITIMCSNEVQVVHNPDFFSNPNYWFKHPGTYLDAHWLPEDTQYQSSGGIIDFTGSLPGFTTDTIYIWQNISFPESSITNAVLSVTYRVAQNGIYFGYLVVELYNASSGSVAWYGTHNINGLGVTPYQTYSWTINSGITPGANFVLIVGIYVESILQSTVDFRIDSVYLNVTTSQYIYSNIALLINDTINHNYYAKLALVPQDSELASDLSINISLIGVYGSSTTSITIVNGTILSDVTSVLKLSEAPQGYTSAYVRVSASKGALINSTLALELIYTTDDGKGAEVIYPIYLIVDPSSNIIYSSTKGQNNISTAIIIPEELSPEPIGVGD